MIASLEHVFDAGVVSVSPTCERTGSQIFTCTVCSNTRVICLEKLPPVMMGEDEKEWNPKSDQGVIFRSAASLVDFLEVRVNGEVVPREYYLLREGSTIVELTPAYLGTLGNGIYTLEIVSTTGIATASLEVTEQTSLVWLWIILAIVALVGVGVTVGWVLCSYQLKAQSPAPVRTPVAKAAPAVSGQAKAVQPKEISQQAPGLPEEGQNHQQ